MPPPGPDVVRPREAQPAHIARVDLIERTVARLARREAVGEPFGAGLAGILQDSVVDGFGRCWPMAVEAARVNPTDKSTDRFGLNFNLDKRISDFLSPVVTEISRTELN